MNTDFLLQEFGLQLQARKYSLDTISNYKSAVSIFLSVASTKFDDPTQITAKDIEHYVAWLVERRNVGHSYRRTCVATLIKFYDMVFDIHMPLEHLYPKRPVKKLPNHLNREEIKRLFEVCENIKHRCIIGLLYSAGLRLSELLHLSISDIDAKANVIHIKASKGYKARKTLLSDKLWVDIKRYYLEYKPQKYLFEGVNGAMYSERSVQEVVKKVASRAGIQKKVTPHILRHSFATHLLENGADIKFIQELLGHQSVKTTEIYAQVSVSKVKSPMDQILF